MARILLPPPGSVPDSVQVTRVDQDRSRVEVSWTRVDDQGQEVVETSGYWELASGLNYWDDSTGNWESSVEEIVLATEGAVALRGPHRVIFAPTLDDPEGSVDLVASDGRRFRSSILSLGYFDPVSGQRALLGWVRDVPGELIPPNQVIYRDAFEPVEEGIEIEADVVLTYRRGSLEQDIVLRSMPSPPEALGMAWEVAQLEVLTEFYEAPEPMEHRVILAAVENPVLRGQVAEPDWTDVHLDFGGMAMGAGRAFPLPGLGEEEGGFEEPKVTVGKRWIVEGDRRVLAERVEYVEVLPGLLALPGGEQAKRDPEEGELDWGLAGVGEPRQTRWARAWERQGASPQMAVAAKLPGRRWAGSRGEPQWKRQPLLLATEGVENRPGFVLDYVILNTGSSNFTFRGDETYHVTDEVHLTGTTTMEGGAVLKYAKYSGTPAAQIKVFGPWNSATSMYRPAVLTASDDQSVGAWITNSAAQPASNNYYVVHGLWFQGDTNQVVKVEHLRVRHASHALLFYGRSGTVRHVQFERCAFPVYAHHGAAVRVENLLAADLYEINSGTKAAPFKGYYGGSLVGENLTVHGARKLLDTDGSVGLTLRNALLVGIDSIQTYTGQSDPSASNHETSSATGLFWEVGAGKYYLDLDSPHRDVGTTNVSVALGSDLALMTTWPPQLLVSDFTSNHLLLPVEGLRDASLPDRGYHYPALDYCLSSLNLTNSTLTLSNGVAVGVYGPKGLTLRRNSRLLSVGSPTRPNRLVRYHTVQEGTNNWGAAPTNSFSFLEVNSGGSTPTSTIDLRHTEIHHLGVSTNATTARRLLGAGASSHGGTVALSHCHLGGVSLDISYALSQPQTVAMTNNLFHGCVLAFTDTAGYGTYALSAYNNLFHRGSLSLNNQHSGSVWILKDNLLTSDGATLGGSYATNYYIVTHNGFRSGLAALGTSARTNLALDFQTGPLGRFYYPSSGSLPSLAGLVNQGSRNATNVGLWHYTLTADRRKETNSMVDIGFHYLATDEDGVPVDSDGDGIGDHELDPMGTGFGDSDYDGIHDAEEVAQGKDPHNPYNTVARRLGYWRFNHSSLTNEAGFGPMETNVVPVGTWSGTGVGITNTSQGLRYRPVEANGAANINLRSGTVRFWFQPRWSSASVGGSGPGNGTDLIQVGPDSRGAAWFLGTGHDGNQLTFASYQQVGDVADILMGLDHIRVNIAWTNELWHQIALTYSPTNYALFLDGRLVSHDDNHHDLRPVIKQGTNILERLNLGEGIRFYPQADLRSAGMRIANRMDGGNMRPAMGVLDELEIYNYPLSASEIARGFHTFPAGTTPHPTVDTDYDGRSDFMETLVDGTNPNLQTNVAGARLGYWRFNDASCTGEGGQQLLAGPTAALTDGWSGKAASFPTLGSSQVGYRHVETNGWPNINLAQGSVRLWFKPYWSSGSGPSAGTLLWAGDAAQPSLGSWTLRFSELGQRLQLVTSYGGTTVTNLNSVVTVSSGHWYQLAVNYSSSGVTGFLGGTNTAGLQALSGTAITIWPTIGGLHMGSTSSGGSRLDGAIDEVETWTRPLTEEEVETSFLTLKRFDDDLNEVPDVAELKVNGTNHWPYLGEPFAITGAFEAEQFDQGGHEYGYFGTGTVLTNQYRPSPLLITPTTDVISDGAGGWEDLSGFDLHLAKDQWVKYTVDVRVKGTYVIEARAQSYGTGNGAFKVEVSQTGSGTYTNTGPLVVQGTNWTSVGKKMLELKAGTNVLRLMAVTNAPGQSKAARFNYLTVYPSWQEGFTNTNFNVVTVTGLTADNNDWSTARNNTLAIQAVINDITTTTNVPGRVQLPSGTFYLAQAAVQEIADSQLNTALFVGKNNLEIVGAGKTNTTLIAHNRATTMMFVGRTSAGINAVTNFVLRDLTFAGRPHQVAVSDGGGGYTTTFENGWLLVPANRTTGALIMCNGNKDTGPTVNVLVTHVRFQNPPNSSWWMHDGSFWVSNLVFRSCEFIDRMEPEGIAINPNQASSGLPNTTTHPTWSSAHIMGKAASANNVLVISNWFNGNVNVTNGINYTPYNAGDGLLWLQGGGNWYVADNWVTNHYLEGIQLNGGPAAGVRNRFVTHMNTGSCTAFNIFGQWPGATGQDADHSYHLLANWIWGGRSAFSGHYWERVYHKRCRVDIAGNVALLDSLESILKGAPGAFLGQDASRFIHLSGNHLVMGGVGLIQGLGEGVTFVLHNDFAEVEFRGIHDDQPTSDFIGGLVLGNTIGRGDNDHLRPKALNAARWLFRGNTYLNGLATVDLQVNQSALPVHQQP
jgi:hypothetical protein